MYDFAVHPSGKLCVSVSKDNTMKIWNLVHGRCAFTRRLKGAADCVRWHRSLEFYFLVVGNEVQVYDSENNNECTATISRGSRVNSACFVDIGASSTENTSKKGIYIAIIYEDKVLRIVTETGSDMGPELSLAKCLHGARPKDVFACRANLNVCSHDSEFASFMEGEGDCLTIASSAGHLQVLSARKLSQGDPEATSIKSKDPVAFARLSSFIIDAEPRLTAVVAYDPAQHTQGPVKSEDTAPETDGERRVDKKRKPGEERESTTTIVTKKKKKKKKKKEEEEEKEKEKKEKEEEEKEKR